MMAAKMTAQQFDAATPRLGRMTAENIAIARKVLVDGMTKTEAAQAHCLTKQRVGAIVEAVEAGINEAPPGWEKIEVWLPPHLAEQVRQLEAQARAEASRASA